MTWHRYLTKHEAVASISKGVSGFRATGIFPLNPIVFSDEDFLPAETLNNEIIVQDCSTSQKPSASVTTPRPSSRSVVVMNTPQTEPTAPVLMLASARSLAMTSKSQTDAAVSVPTLASASLRALNTPQTYVSAFSYATPPRPAISQTSTSPIESSSSILSLTPAR